MHLPLCLATPLPKDVPLFAADGGLNHLLDLNVTMSNLTWAGDADSYNQYSQHFLENPTPFPKRIIKLNPVKDFSDLAAILDIIVTEHQQECLFIEIYGGLGGRRDHEVSNIAEVKRALMLLSKGAVAYFHGGVVITSLALKFSESSYKLFSIFDNKPVEITGCQYSGYFTLERPSHGLSNKVVEKTFSITPLGGVSTIYFEG